MKLQNRVALISGGASGLGAATAKAMIAEGAFVMLADINDEKGKAAAAAMGDRAGYTHLDVTQPDNWDSAVKAAQEAFGTISILVNSAGVSIPSSIEDATADHWRTIMSINLDGTFYGCKAGVAAMKSGGGAIINMASTLGERAASIFPAYGASKAAIQQLTKSVALHCGEQKYGIRCNAVLPGAIHTEMFDTYIKQGVAAGATEQQVIASFAQGHVLGRIGQPEEVAAMCVFLASDEASFITGGDYLVDGGFCA